jgi:hypothetical protein
MTSSEIAGWLLTSSLTAPNKGGATAPPFHCGMTCGGGVPKSRDPEYSELLCWWAVGKGAYPAIFLFPNARVT